MVAKRLPVKEVTESLGIGENGIYCWRSHQESKETENAADSTNRQALLKHIRELETERNILKKP